VVVSRVTSREGLKILIIDKDDEDTDETSNVVYEEVFRQSIIGSIIFSKILYFSFLNLVIMQLYI